MQELNYIYKLCLHVCLYICKSCIKMGVMKNFYRGQKNSNGVHVIGKQKDKMEETTVEWEGTRKSNGRIKWEQRRETWWQPLLWMLPFKMDGKMENILSATLPGQHVFNHILCILFGKTEVQDKITLLCACKLCVYIQSALAICTLQDTNFQKTFALSVIVLCHVCDEPCHL